MRDPSSSRGDRVLDLSRLASRDRGRDRPRSSFLSLLLLLLLLLEEEWDLRLRFRCFRCFRCFRSFLSLLSRLSLFSLLLRLRLRLEDRDRESVRETDRCFRSFLSLLCRFSLFSLLLRLRLRLEERDRESVRETDRERPISFPRARTLCPPPQRRIVRRVDPLFANFRENWRAQQPEPERHASEAISAISGRRTEEIRALAFVRARIRIADPHEERGHGQSKRVYAEWFSRAFHGGRYGARGCDGQEPQRAAPARG